MRRQPWGWPEQAAAGAVGSIVGQLGKAGGLRIVGAADSDEKCERLTGELGFDAAINYKSESLREEIETATPDGVDNYFDNTGGPVQQIVFYRMNDLLYRSAGILKSPRDAQLAPGNKLQSYRWHLTRASLTKSAWNHERLPSVVQQDALLPTV